ncbi:VOC family protein [Acidobacteria bacterium AH-259-L09]|nr:VOC family protein [Acidobacteria bacterium AH-259-L09]
MKRDEFPAPREGILLTHFLTVEDVERSRAFYSDVLGGQILLERDPCIIKLANAWVTLNVGGGPTEDKPDVILAPPVDPKKASSFMNIRVADIKAQYDEWRSKGAEFLTPPIDRGGEIRCYMRDPDGYLIEVGEATGILQMLEGEESS